MFEWVPGEYRLGKRLGMVPVLNPGVRKTPASLLQLARCSHFGKGKTEAWWRLQTNTFLTPGILVEVLDVVTNESTIGRIESPMAGWIPLSFGHVILPPINMMLARPISRTLFSCLNLGGDEIEAVELPTDVTVGTFRVKLAAHMNVDPNRLMIVLPNNAVLADLEATVSATPLVDACCLDCKTTNHKRRRIRGKSSFSSKGVRNA